MTAVPARALGRRLDVQHDPRSLAYAHGVLPKSAIGPKRWIRRAPVFDQGQLGSCTGNAAAGLVGTDNAVRIGLTSFDLSVEAAARTHGVFLGGRMVTVDEAFAVLCYELNTRLDAYSGTYKPTDSGSDGLAAAKTLQALGLADSYTHAFSIDALDSALQAGPVMVGTTWLNSMHDPDGSNYLTVDPASGVAGGHEWIVDELLASGDYAMQNSWGTSWGANGRAYLRRADMQWLLTQHGDVTVPHLVDVAAPTPPPTPAPTPADPVAALHADLYDNGDQWMRSTRYGPNRRAQQRIAQFFAQEGMST